jgi:DNA-binding NarL/FixJ family response regulator
MFLQSVRSMLLDAVPSLDIDVAATLREALEAASLGCHDLVLLDWHLPDAEGADAVRRLQSAGCVARIVVLSGDASADHITKALGAGAAGFIPKTYSFELLIAALGLVLQGGVFLPPEVLGHALPPMPAPRASAGPEAELPGGAYAQAAAPTAAVAPPYTLVDLQTRFPSLTTRQLDVYRAATRGLSNKLIARELGIAESTVKTHLSVVFAELGVSNRTQAVLQASREAFRVA